ncbi:MAG: hypothetical protein AAF404_18870 [Pseudomonadota bacterium]
MTQSTDTAALDRGTKLLAWVSYGLLVFAAVWWLAVHPAIDKQAALMIDIMAWPIDGSHDNMARDARFFSVIGAGLVVGLAGFLLLVIIPEFRRGNRQIWRGTVIALFGWYIVDSAGCWIAGVPSNVLFNTIFLVLLLVPLWMIRSALEPSAH